MDNKLNGTYLIPLFSGDTGTGHWSLCVVRKLSQINVEAWSIDSLGKGNASGPLQSKIKTAFALGRAKMIWNTCMCQCQEEAESRGPRTILAMKFILEGKINNKPTEDCIQKATMTRYPYINHIPSMIREESAHFVNLFTPDMDTPPIWIQTERRRINTPTASATDT